MSNGGIGFADVNLFKNRQTGNETYFRRLKNGTNYAASYICTSTNSTNLCRDPWPCYDPVLFSGYNPDGGSILQDMF